MTKKYTFLLWFSFSMFMLSSCSDDNTYTLIEDEPVSPVIFDLASVPYSTLSEYNFFEGDISELDPVYGVLPFTLNTTLFTDYAKKKRFVWMPDNVSASYVNDHSILNFPTGTVLIKNFYYENVLPDNTTKIIETRLMIKMDSGWDFANYIWNDDQTEAYFSNEGEVVSLDWVEGTETKSVNYKIPRRAECVTCHNNADQPRPIGVKPQNLNLNYPYSNATMNQLLKLVEQGYLNDNFPNNITSTIDWKDTSQPLELRVRSYFDINCAHCHSDQGYCNYTDMRFGFENTEDVENLGVCVENNFYLGETISHIVKPGDPNASALFFRIASDQDEYKMPLIGRTLVHEEGVALIGEWINSLQTNCNN